MNQEVHEIIDPVFSQGIGLDEELMDPKIPYSTGDREEQISFRMKVQQVRDIDILVQRVEGLPFKSRSDFMRTAAYTYWLWLIQASKTGNAKLRQRAFEERLATNANDNAEWMTRQQKVLLDIHNYVTSLINQMAVDELYRVLDEYYEMLTSIPVLYVQRQYIKNVGNLASVRLAVAILNATGLGVPPHYISGRVINGSGVRNGSKSLSAGSGISSGDAGADVGLFEPGEPGEYDQERVAAGVEGSRRNGYEEPGEEEPGDS